MPTPEEGLDALRHIDRKILEYSPSEGLLSLREKLRQYYHRFNIEVDTDDARLLAITVPGEGGIFARGRDIKIPWACIEHIGDDLIIVNMKNLTPRN